MDTTFKWRMYMNTAAGVDIVHVCFASLHLHVFGCSFISLAFIHNLATDFTKSLEIYICICINNLSLYATTKKISTDQRLRPCFTEYKVLIIKACCMYRTVCKEKEEKTQLWLNSNSNPLNGKRPRKMCVLKLDLKLTDLETPQIFLPLLFLLLFYWKQQKKSFIDQLENKIWITFNSTALNHIERIMDLTSSSLNWDEIDFKEHLELINITIRKNNFDASF